MEKKIPFVITEDIRSITRDRSFTVSESMANCVSHRIIEICKEFITPDVILLREKTMVEWIAKVVPQNAILQTLAYTDLLPCYPELQLTRATSWQDSKPRHIPRYGYGSLEAQLQFLEKGSYSLVDDVIFSGDGACEVILAGRKLGRSFTKVICCVSIEEGKQKIKDLNVEVEALYHFENVVDEVCLRDFIPGLPFSGRPFVQNPEFYSGPHKFVPYLLPWGNPHDRISVPAHNQVKFSIACLELSIEFWLEVAPELKLVDAPTSIYDLQADENMCLIHYLHQCKEILEQSP